VTAAPPPTCSFLTVLGSESVQGGTADGRLRYLATWRAVVDCPGANPLDGIEVVFQQATQLQRSGNEVAGTTRVELALPGGSTVVTHGTVHGSGACTTTVCTLELESKSAGDRLRLRGTATLTVDRLTGDVLSFQGDSNEGTGI
jgi:hypothetical protein